MGSEPKARWSAKAVEARGKGSKGRRTVLAWAGVHLEGVLVGEDVELDAGEVAREGGHGALGTPVVGAVLGAVDQPGVVVADAAEAAVVLDLGRRVVGAELLGCGPEVVDRVLLVGQDGAIRDENVVDTDALAGVGQVQGVVVGGGRVRVGEGIQVPVDLFIWSGSVRCSHWT